jgi:hypothetical protein
MNKKSFFWGVVTGIVLTFVALFVYVSVNQKPSDLIQYLEQPVSYENKKETSFKVFQVLDNVALATEESFRIHDDAMFDGKTVVMFDGKTVVVLGDNFYNDQIVNVKNPQRVGTFNYTNNGGRPMIVPVIKGDMK